MVAGRGVAVVACRLGGAGIQAWVTARTQRVVARVGGWAPFRVLARGRFGRRCVHAGRRHANLAPPAVGVVASALVDAPVRAVRVAILRIAAHIARLAQLVAARPLGTPVLARGRRARVGVRPLGLVHAPDADVAGDTLRVVA